MNKKALCIVSKFPKIEWLNFLSKFENYDVYIVADDNSEDYCSIYNNFYNVKILQFQDKECEESGFVGTLKHIRNKFVNERSVFGWDKAFYYFAKINSSYEYVWMLEEDVFFYNEQSLLNIDEIHPKEDLLCKKIIEHFIGTDSNLSYPNEWWWPTINRLGGLKFDSPFLRSDAYQIRVSKKLIEKIEEYADTYKTLFYHEACVPMICVKNNLSYSFPEEMQISRPCIELCSCCIKPNIPKYGKRYLFHPIKDLKEHEIFRDQIEKYQND